MNAVLTPLKVEELHLPRHYEAEDLDGVLPCEAVLSKLSDADLEHVAQQAHEAAESATFLCADVVVEMVRRAGPKRTDRAKAIRAYQNLTKSGSWRVYGLFNVGRWMTPDVRADFPQLSYEQCFEIVRNTYRKGDTKAERVERMDRLAREAADAELSVNQCRQLATSVDRPEPSRGDYLEIGDHEVTPSIAETEPPPATPFPRAVTATEQRFSRALVDAYCEWQPGTAQMVAAMVVDVLRRGGFVVTEAGL